MLFYYSFFGDVITASKKENLDPKENQICTVKKCIEKPLIDESVCTKISLSSTSIEKDTESTKCIKTTKSSRASKKDEQFLIKQGQSKYHKKQVPSGVTCLDIKLEWGNKNNSLSLTVTPPNGGSGGTYSGNGSITLRRDKDVQGTWGFKVYGVSVSGTEKYTFKAALHK
jgi:hypothetical protein